MGILPKIARSIAMQEVVAKLSLAIADPSGVIVSYVEQGSPADRAGVKRGDVIKMVNGQAVQGIDQARRAC